MLRGEGREYVASLARTLANLQMGYWGGGTRVKRLRSVRTPVYEARLDAGARLIFTVAVTAPCSQPVTLEPHLLVWDVRTHDRVNTVRRLNLEPEAAFLDLPVEWERELDAPPVDALSFADDAGGGAVAAAWRPADSLSASCSGDELHDAVRWCALDPEWVLDDAAWQRLFDAGTDAFELKLTGVQYRVLTEHGPILVSGAAGSGKSTLTVHWLARHVVLFPTVRALYATYSGALLDQTRGWFERLLRARDVRVANEPLFVTFPDLCRRIAGDNVALPMRFPEFARWYSQQTRRQDAALAWEEIRGIVKGACLDPARPMLAREEYEELGRKRAPLFVGERPRLYAVARRYADWLAHERREDDVDLARAALRRASHGAEWRFDAIVCDEIQDLTEVEMALLLALHRDRTCRALFVTGDPQQIVNPSGFRWGELRTLLRAQRRNVGAAVPRVIRLTRGFRSVRGVVNLANAFLDVMRIRTGRGDDDTADEGVTLGPTPLLVEGSEEELLAALRGFGPRVAIIAPTDALAGELRARLGTARVFDVPSAKGLEFDAVVLWSFFSSSAALWTDLLTGTASFKEDPVARSAIRHAYVAVTRARRWIAVCEPDATRALWLAPAFRALLERDSHAVLARFISTASTPEEWAEQGRYYLARGRFRQAEECFRRAGDEREAQRAEARFFAEAGEWARAAAAYAALEQWGDAAGHYERAGSFDTAAELFDRAGDAVAARRARIALWSQHGEWDKVASAHEEREEWEQAAQAWNRGGHRVAARAALIRHHAAANNWSAVAQVHADAHEWDKAAAAFDRAGMAADARRCRQHADAATAHHGLPHAPARKQRDWKSRAVRFESRGDLKAALRALEHVDDPQAGIRREAIRAELDREFEAAARAYHTLADWHAVARVAEHFRSRARDDAVRDMDAGHHMRVLKAVADIHIAAEAGPGEALQVIKTCGIYADEVVRLEARYLEEAGRWPDAARVYAELGDLPAARRCAGHLPNGEKVVIEIEAIQAEKERRWADAATLWEKIGKRKEHAAARARAAEASGDIAAAAAAWEAAGKRNRARKLRAALGPGPDDLFALDAAADTSTPAATMPVRLLSPDARVEREIAFITDHPWCTRKDLCRALDISASMLANDTARITLDGRIAEARRGRELCYVACVHCREKNIPVSCRDGQWIAHARVRVVPASESGPAA